MHKYRGVGFLFLWKRAQMKNIDKCGKKAKINFFNTEKIRQQSVSQQVYCLHDIEEYWETAQCILIPCTPGCSGRHGTSQELIAIDTKSDRYIDSLDCQ